MLHSINQTSLYPYYHYHRLHALQSTGVLISEPSVLWREGFLVFDVKDQLQKLELADKLTKEIVQENTVIIDPQGLNYWRLISMSKK